MNVRRFAVALSGFAMVAAAPMSAYAAAAPAGVAQSSVVGISSVLGIGTTSAQAGSDGTSSSADAVAVNGDPAQPQTGGSQTGAGTSSNSLVDTGDTAAGRVEVTPWSVSNSDSESTASAAVARVSLLRQISLAVMRSRSNATWTESGSSGSASSDGAVVTLPNGTTVVLFHTGGDSSGEGGSYAAALDDMRFATTDDASGACARGLLDLLDLNCLTASGGSGSAEASFGDAALDRGSGLPLVAAGVLSAGASGSDDAVAPGAAEASSDAPGAVSGDVNGTGSHSLLGSPAGAVAAAALAFTGTAVGTMVLLGLVFIGLGGAVLATRRSWNALVPLPATTA